MRRNPNNQARLELEQLEGRQLMAGQILLDAASGLVTINGTNAPDLARVFADDGRVRVVLTCGNGSNARTEQAFFDPAEVQAVLFQGFGGNDRFLNDLDVPSTAYGGPGRDYLEGGSAGDDLDGGRGNDTLVGFGGDDTLSGGAKNDLLFGMGDNDVLFDSSGRNKLYGGGGANALTGGRRDVIDNSSDGPLYQVAGPRSLKLQDTPPDPVAPDPDISSLEAAIIELTNRERTRAGLAPLRVSDRLMNAARHHANNMARANRMVHTLSGADLPDLHSRLTHYGYRYLNGGENIAYNFRTASSVVSAWMNSPGHRANILNPDFRDIGVAVAHNSRGDPYICQVFGRSL